MILRSTSAQDAADEQKILAWYEENFGADDSREVAEWIWSHERNAARYLRALFHCASLVKEHGRGVFAALLEQARKVASQHEPEEQLMAALAPVVERVRITITGHRGAEEAVGAGLRELRVRLREELRRMWPDKHRATIDGAIVAGSQIRNGGAFLDFGKIVEVMSGPDALATTAASSHGVTDDR